MRTFCDTAGREWTLDVTVASVKRVREATGVLLPGLFDDDMKPLGELSADYERLCDVLWSLCCKQAAERGVDAEQFAESLGGDALGNAGEALVRATADFFTFPEQREALHKMIDKLTETAKEFVTTTGNRIAAIDTHQLAQSCSDFVMSTPAKSASIPTREPLASCS